MKVVEFDGVAPIPQGTKVDVLVDESGTPARALQVEDLDRNIKYTNRRYAAVLSPQTAREPHVRWVKAKVLRVEISCFIALFKSRLEIEITSS